MEDCLFCKIIKKEIESQIVFENESVIAFKDINPQAPVHILIVPKEHFTSFLDVSYADTQLVIDIFQAAKKIAQKEGIAEKGFRFAVNVGDEGGQIIKHLHFHLLGGRQLSGSLG
ncbi:MAG: histidine triad nucleotide-binding protein [Actinobacteria bacterium]|nr:histidine triad nucleotide-binding protein [Actinomycetota bacterium]